MKEEYNVCIVGAGAVGEMLIHQLQSRRFPMKSLRIFGRTSRSQHINGKLWTVEETTASSFEGMDFAFFAGTEGEKGASKMFAHIAAEQGCIVIDNGDDFRMAENVPLIVPEINADALHKNIGIIANPNCSTIITLMALAPLHRLVRIKRIVASTYQAVSGTGSAAMYELANQTRAWVTGTSEAMPEPQVYPHRILFNVLPVVGSLSGPGAESTEEVKMRRETRKILADETIAVSATCVRVPVFNGHCISLNVEFRGSISRAEALRALLDAPGVRPVDAPADHLYPMPILTAMQDDVFVGRIRKDESVEHGLALWVAGDNLLKGAALNAVQIAELIIGKKAK